MQFFNMSSTDNWKNNILREDFYVAFIRLNHQLSVVRYTHELELATKEEVVMWKLQS